MLSKTLNDKKLKAARAVLLANASALALSACGGSDTPAPAPVDPEVAPDPRNFINGTVDADSVPGSMGDDVIDALAGGDFVLALAGNDEIYGGDGDDTIWADEGDDVIYGGAGNDTIYPGAGDDLSYGGEGDDVIYLSSGNDKEDGGEGNDTLKIASNHSGIATTIDLLLGQYYFTAQGSSAFFNLTSIENVDSQASADLTILDTPEVNVITTGTGNDIVKSVGGNDIISTGGGDDRVELATGFIYDVKSGSGDDEVILALSYSALDGGSGTDTLTVKELNGISDFYADLSAGFYFFKGVATSQDGFDTLLAGFETVVVEGQVNAELIGGIGAETFTTDGGADKVTAGGGDDVIRVGADADTVTGGAGNDAIDLGAADLAADVVIFSAAASNGADTITSFETGVDALNVASVASLAGTLAVDTTANGAALALSAAKVLVVTDDTEADWSDVALKMAAGIDLSADDASSTVIVVDNGTDSRVYLYEDDGEENLDILDAELTLLATLTATILAEGDLVVA
jgi:Ca2+-binding RTX toxin-like protein